MRRRPSADDARLICGHQCPCCVTHMHMTTRVQFINDIVIRLLVHDKLNCRCIALNYSWDSIVASIVTKWNSDWQIDTNRTHGPLYFAMLVFNRRCRNRMQCECSLVLTAYPEIINGFSGVQRGVAYKVQWLCNWRWFIFIQMFARLCPRAWYGYFRLTNGE